MTSILSYLIIIPIISETLASPIVINKSKSVKMEIVSTSPRFDQNTNPTHEKNTPSSTSNPGPKYLQTPNAEKQNGEQFTWYTANSDSNLKSTPQTYSNDGNYYNQQTLSVERLNPSEEFTGPISANQENTRVVVYEIQNPNTASAENRILSEVISSNRDIPGNLHTTQFPSADGYNLNRSYQYEFNTHSNRYVTFFEKIFTNVQTSQAMTEISEFLNSPQAVSALVSTIVTR